MTMRIVALMTVRNEALYMERCLTHLHAQGIETCVIDNESTDQTREIVEAFRGRGVFRVENLPYRGRFELAAQCRFLEKLATEIDADWFIRQDADEIREAPWPSDSLSQAISIADRSGFNAIDFDEFIFVPTSEKESFEGTDYVELMRYYFYLDLQPLNHVNAWKNHGQAIDLTSSGGHAVMFDGRTIFPTKFILRHYMILSGDHARRKYQTRKFDESEVFERGWHGWRAQFAVERVRLPERAQLKQLGIEGGWDTSEPQKYHLFID
jgi:glycosyltransferase involved in cell wall biosynthesis